MKDFVMFAVADAPAPPPPAGAAPPPVHDPAARGPIRSPAGGTLRGARLRPSGRSVRQIARGFPAQTSPRHW